MRTLRALRTSTRLLGAWLIALAATQAAAAPLTFGVFGDTPYFPFEESAVRQIIEQMNGERLAHVVHIGDFKSGSSLCSDPLFAERLELFARIQHPFVFVPGDNEWTDCHRGTNGSYQPLERLNVLRRMFHAGDDSLGQRRLRLTRQSNQPKFAPYRENVRWHIDGVMFAAFNVPGSNNNLGRNPEMDDEYRARMVANQAWLSETASSARKDDARALVLFFHADPRFDRWTNETNAKDGYIAWRRMLRVAAALFRKPILVVHGDGHRYRVDQPLRDPANGATTANVTRLEVMGAPETNWVRVTISDGPVARFFIEPGRPRNNATP